MNRAETALAAAEAGADVAGERYQTSLSIDTKSGKMDYVTEADRRAQRAVVETIRADDPEATVVGEEDDELKTMPEAGDAWVVDPIDGTTNFVHEIPLWTTSVAAVRGGETTAAVSIAPALDGVYRADGDGTTWNGDPVAVSEKTDVETFTVAPILRYGPERDDEFGDLMAALIRAFGDLRRFGSAQVTLAKVAAGSLDAAASAQPRPNPWDTVAGVYLVERAGGTVTDVHGDPWDPGCEGLVASNGTAHDEVVAVVQSTMA
ncbi:inositol monophosphatase family protein [Halomicroarcula sp. GCM10025817]|uniref:inositol monophosphatase family protein n=1 Tax=Haloarcula TaxID=2237 RepID=UPI0023E7D9BC|nr:inositol monophosphatase [Halomicroarcula sp. SYNS111]